MPVSSLKVRFIKDFDWHPPERNRRSTIAYKAGTEMTVRRAAGEAAIAAGKAVEVVARGKAAKAEG